MSSLSFFGEPRVPRLSKLLEEFRNGEIRVPRFQRPFVWTDDQRLALMESVYSGYPIGAILVWRTQKHQLKTYDNLGPLELPPIAADVSTRQYLLDGHQRLTTLFAALGPGLYNKSDSSLPKKLSKEDGLRWPMYFDLEFDEYSQNSSGKSREDNPFKLARRKQIVPATWLRLDVLFDSYLLREYEERLKGLGLKKATINRVQAVADAFRDYIIPVMPIVNDDIGKVTTSFKRINSGGTEMSEVHMVNALVYTDQFDLLEELDEIRESLEPASWRTFDRQQILNICKPRLGLALYDERPEIIAEKLKNNRNTLRDVAVDISKVADVLGEVANVKGPSSLPYSYQAVLLADALRDRSRLTAARKEAIRLWFWSTTLTEYFRGMNAALFERARVHLSDLIAGRAQPLPPDIPEVVDSFSRFDFRAARSRGLALLLAEQSEKYGLSGDEDPFQLVSEFASNSMIKAVTSTKGVRERRTDGPENRFLCFPHAVKAFRDELTGSEKTLDSRFMLSHALTKRSLFYLRNGKIDEFLEARKKSLEKIESERAKECGLKYRGEDVDQ